MRKKDNETDAVKKSSKSRLKRFLQLPFQLLFLLLRFSVLFIFQRAETIRPETTAPPVAEAVKVTVPDFCKAGYTESDVKIRPRGIPQFTITFQSEYSKDVEEGLIFEQSVKAGDEVKKGTAIVLTVSKGIETVSVPDVGGKSKDDAVKTLEEEGFKVRVVTIYNDDNDTPNTVRKRKRNGSCSRRGNRQRR